jgi:Glycine transporter
MIPALGAEQVLQTLAGFKDYATTGTLLVLELVGTFVFALSGATAGVKHRLDLFGVLVVSFATATAGGITRDVLIGAVPPAALRDWRYLGISVLAGLVVFFWSPRPGASACFTISCSRSMRPVWRSLPYPAVKRRSLTASTR